VDRFARAEQLAAYAGTTPRVIASGGKMRFGPLRTDVNYYLKWVFVEAANSICLHHHYRPYCLVTAQTYSDARIRHCNEITD
jgi:transposase